MIHTKPVGVGPNAIPVCYVTALYLQNEHPEATYHQKIHLAVGLCRASGQVK
jgi:hypothetical protein